MKRFEMRQIREAMEYATQGYQALHIHNLSSGHPLFKRYAVIAHLMDMNKDRLIATAKSLGVRVIKVEREGEPGQHIDLCGKPFERACQQATIYTERIKLQRVAGWPVLPGQYTFDTTGRVIMACPVCAYVFLCKHTVVRQEPLTLSPSVIGPDKDDADRVSALSQILAIPCLHHFWVKDGFAIDAS